MLRAYDPLIQSIALLAIAATCAPPVVWAGEPTAAENTQAVVAGDEGVLLLNDGGVLRGKIAREGDRYVVTGAKSRMEVAANNVALACASLPAAYEQQRRQLPRDTPETHLGLADWCLRYSLLPQAGQELADVRRLDPHNAKLDLLRRRLDVATQAANPRKAIDDDAEDEKQQSAAEVARLEAIAAELPSGAVERFTRKEQPLLVNNCTTSGCHQMAGKQVFQLDRAVLHGLSNHRTTLSNLAATLALVSRDAPQLSPLLTIPRAEHADMKLPIMGSRQDQQYHQLEEWVAIVTGTPVPELDKSAAHSSPEPSSKRTAAAKRRNKTSQSQTARTEPKPLPADAQPATAANGDQSSQESAGNSPTSDRPASDVVQAGYDEPSPFQQLRERKRAAVQLNTWEPKDAFDPEIFNRQHPRSVATSAKPDNPAASAPAH
jgi:hypothetical protein